MSESNDNTPSADGALEVDKALALHITRMIDSMVMCIMRARGMDEIVVTKDWMASTIQGYHLGRNEVYAADGSLRGWRMVLIPNQTVEK